MRVRATIGVNPARSKEERRKAFPTNPIPGGDPRNAGGGTPAFSRDVAVPPLRAPNDRTDNGGMAVYPIYRITGRGIHAAPPGHVSVARFDTEADTEAAAMAAAQFAVQSRPEWGVCDVVVDVEEDEGMQNPRVRPVLSMTRRGDGRLSGDEFIRVGRISKAG